MRIFTIFKYGPSTAPTIQVLEPRFSVTVTGIGEPLLIHGPVSIVAGVATSKPHVVAVAVVVVVVVVPELAELHVWATKRTGYASVVCTLPLKQLKVKVA
jgi:hypothetical protein